jgi:hypothetical protein
MASIEKRVSNDGAISYRTKVRLRGHEPVSATFQRLTDAKTWAAQTETELKANRYFGASKRHTVAEVIDRYKADGLTHLKSRRSVEQRLDVWRARVGHLLLSDLSVSTIKKHKDEIKALRKQRGDGERSGADVNRTMAALSSALSYAVKELEWLEENPIVRVRKFTESRGRVRYLSEDELPELLKACRASKNPQSDQCDSDGSEHLCSRSGCRKIQDEDDGLSGAVADCANNPGGAVFLHGRPVSGSHRGLTGKPVAIAAHVDQHLAAAPDDGAVCRKPVARDAIAARVQPVFRLEDIGADGRWRLAGVAVDRR